MPTETTAEPVTGPSSTNASFDEAGLWSLILAIAAHVRDASFSPAIGQDYRLRPDARPALQPVSRDHPRRVIRWSPGAGWQLTRPLDNPSLEALAELYLPACAPVGRNRCEVWGHLGQSLDACVATARGESCYVTGDENLRHLHRMRALSDAVLVGTKTAACDNPRLTTRLVPGDNPIRIILDRRRQLPPGLRVLGDGAAETWLICSESAVRASASSPSRGRVIGVPTRDGHLDLEALVARLAELGIRRLFVEGGGATVSAFLARGLLERLQIAVAPLLIGGGRAGLSPPVSARLSDAMCPRTRLYRMGADVLYDMDMRQPRSGRNEKPPVGLVRIA